MTRKERSEVIERAKGRVRLAVGAIFVLSLLALGALVSLFLPYTPLTVHSYESANTELCPQELTSVVVDYSMEDAESVNKIEVEPAWIAHDVPGFERRQRIEASDSIPVSYPIREGRRTIESNVLRVAPNQPGEWRIAAELKVYGTAYGTPHVQVLYPEADKVTTVLSADECEEKP